MNSEQQDNSELSDLLYSCLIGIIAIVHLVLFTNRRCSDTNISMQVKVAPCGYFEGMRRFCAKDCPTFLVQMMKSCNCNIFKLRFPIKHGGIFIVGDPFIARKILLDPLSTKPHLIYGRFDKITTGKTFLNRQNNDPVFVHSKKGIAPAFSSREIKRINRICVERFQDWIEAKLGPSTARNETIDPSKEMLHLFLSTFLDSEFEYNATEAEVREVCENLEIAAIEFILKEGNPFRKVFGLLIPARYRAFRAARDVSLFMSKVLNTYREKKDKSSNNTIIKLIANNPIYKNDKERLPDLVMMMMAGHDTTAYQLASTIILLAKHPKVADKLYSELSETDASEWSKSKYLDCVIKESSRLVPVSALAAIRTTSRAFYSRDGSVVIPKGAMANLNVHLLHHNPEVFSNPDTFDPERWMNPSQEAKDSMMLFSLGKRSCPGQRLALTEMYSCIPILFSKYKFEVVEHGKLQLFLTWKYEGVHLKAEKKVPST